jgi:hypothetical protein
MRRELTYRVQVRDRGEGWQTTWAGPGQAVAIEAARALGREARHLPGVARPFAVHPYVRVVQGPHLVLLITPENREGAPA